MPLLSIDIPHPQVRMGLWKMSEPIDRYPRWAETARQLYRSEARQREYVFVRALLQQMSEGAECPTISHLESGKPVLDNGQHISISHTKGYCAVILSPSMEVAIDIEYRSDRVSRIVHKFIRADERAETVVSQLIHWSAKETVYKLFSEDNLLYEEMRVQPFDEDTASEIMVDHLRRSFSLGVQFHVTDDYVLTFSYK